MDEKILTVTIPSYNVEAYLEDCLESFVNSEVMDDIEKENPEIKKFN